MTEQKIHNSRISKQTTKSVVLFLKLKFSKIKKNVLIICKKLVQKTNKIRLTRNEISILVIICAAVFTMLFCYHVNKQSDVVVSDNTKTSNKAGLLSKGSPDFKTILPAGKTIKDFGGWTRVSPSNVAPVYAYVDKIGDISINVSQQPLPDEFESDTDAQVENLATDFKAAQKLMVGKTTVFIGTSAKGPQSIIFAKNNLLIMIKSSVQISDEKWSDYINLLQ